MGIVNIQGIGGVEFPDDMSPQDIQKAIETEILPKFPDVVSKGKRSWGEALTDIGGGFISGLGGLAQLPGQIGQLAGLTEREETPTGLQGIGKTVEEYGQSLKSPVIRAKEQLRSQKIAAAEGEGTAMDVAKQAGVAFLETVKDPALLTSFFAEQVPNLFGSMGGGLLARGGVKLLMRNAADDVIGKAGVAGAVGTGTVMQGADVGSDTYEAVYKRLAKEQPDMPVEERNRIALAQGRQAALQAAGISLATAALPGGRSIERALAGKGAPGVGGFTRGFLGESGSEALEEGGGQFVSNVAQQEIFPDVRLSQNVGQAAGMGALGGGLFGGVAGSMNARNESQRQAAIEAIQLEKDAFEAADFEARKLANDAYNAEIKSRAMLEQYGESDAYKELAAEVDAIKAKAQAAQAKVDARKAKMSAFAKEYPDLLGDYIPPQDKQQTGEEQQEGAPQVLPGQLALPLTDQEGQLGLPGVGGAQPTAITEQATPVEALIINRDLTKALGIAGGARKVRNAIEGKDLTDPKQRAQVRDVLSDFANRTTAKDAKGKSVAANIEAFLNSPFFSEQDRLRLRRKPVSAKQSKAAMASQLENAFGAQLAQTQGIKVPSQKLPAERERKAGKAQDFQNTLQNMFGGTLAQTEGVPVPDNLLPYERENLTTAQELRDSFQNKIQQALGKPVTKTPSTQETQNVPTGQPAGVPTTAKPRAGRSTGKQGVGVAGVGAGSTTQQTSAAQGVQDTRPTGLAGVAGGTKSDVRAAKAAPAAVAKNLKGAARFEAEYLAEVSGDRNLMLRYLAADLYAKENMRRANPVYKALSAEEKANIDEQVASLKAQEKRATDYLSKLNADQYQIRDYASGAKAPPEVRRVVYGTTSPALLAAAYRGSTARALNEIANSSNYSPLERAIARRLMSNKRYSLPKIEIVPKDQLGQADGQYDPFTDTVRIAEGQVDSHTVLHEVVHGYMHALITEFERGAISNKALAELQDLYNHLLQNHPELAEQYGMTSLTEFAAEAMSNPEFQEALKQIPYKKRNVFQEFAKLVMQLLGLSDTNNALAEAIINVERAMNIGRGYQQEVSGTAKAPPAANVVRKAEFEATFKAAGGKDVTKQNPSPVGTALKENGNASETEAARRVTTWLDKFETGALSFDAGLNNAIRRELGKEKRDWNVIKDVMTKISTSQALHSDALAMQFLEHGALKYDPKIFKFFAQDSKDSWKNMMGLMSDVAKRNGLTDAELRNYANTAFIAERVEGLAKSNPEFYSHMTKDQVAAGKKLFDMIDGLREVQTMWNGIRKNAMDVAVENGLYSREQADDLLKYMDFVPFYREDQLEAGSGPRKYPNGFIDFAKGFKIKGSDQPVADVFGNMALWTTYTVSRAVRNRTALNMYGTVKDIMPDQVEDIRQDESVKRSDNVVSMWENGQRKRVKFADPLFVHAFEGMETVALPILRDVSKATNFLRQSIVLNPLFSVSQLSQDSFAAMLTSGLKNPLMIPIEVMRQFINILFGGNATGKYLSRAGVVGINDYMSAISTNNLEIATGLKKKSVFQKLLTPLEKFSMASDNAVRQALYNRTLLETGGKRQKDGSVVGGDESAAMERAFEIINFKRSGANGLVNVGKQLVPFFGAYLQAMNVTAKVLAGRSITPTERAAAYKTLAWNTMMVTALAFMYSAMVSGDDDYEKMDPQVRDKHLLIPGTGFMLPLRSDMTMFPKLIAEYSYLNMTDNGFTDGKKVRRAMSEALANAILSPTVVPQFIKPAVEVGINHNFFTGRDLVGKGIAGLDKEAQYTASTSELGKFLGKLGILAPVEIDHLIKGYAGSVGGVLLLGTNAIMGDSGVPKPEKSDRDVLRQIPGMGTFFASEYGNAMKNDFYELREEVARTVKTLNAYKKESPEKAREYMQEKLPLLRLQGQVNTIGNQLTKLREYEKQIRSFPESRMDAERKTAELQRLKVAEDRMLQNVYKLRNMAGY
jgi:hypothetical protein